MLRAVDDRKNVDLIRLDVVDDSKGTVHDLPNLRNSEFPDLTSRQGKLRNLLRAPRQPIDNAQGLLR